MMRRRLSRRLFLLVPLLLLGALGWHTHRQVWQARLDNELVAAANANDVGRVNALLDQGASPNARPRARGATGWRGLVDAVLGRRRPIDSPVIATAVRHERWGVVMALARHKATLTAWVWPPGTVVWWQGWPTTVLGRAVCFSHSPSVVRALLDCGADPNTTDAVPVLADPLGPRRATTWHPTEQDARTDGFSVLHMACELDDAEMVQLLLERGARANAGDAYGRTPLMLAAGAGRLRGLRLLLAYGAGAQARNRNGQTALHYAVAWWSTGLVSDDAETVRNSRESVAVLLASGADPTARDDDGKTPAELTADPALRRLLLQAEADWRRRHPAAAGAQGSR